MKLLCLVFSLCFVAPALGTDVAQLDNGFAKSSFDSKVVNVTVIDQKKAEELFDKLGSDSEIPYKNTVISCQARAHVLAHKAEAAGIKMGKIFVEGNLQAKKDGKIISWAWHVAPVVFVEQPGGKKELMVFDPFLIRVSGDPESL